MAALYYVPVYANWEGEILPTKLTSGAVAFYSPSFAPPDERPSKLNAVAPAYWMAVDAQTPLIYQSQYFVVLGEHNTIVDARVPAKPTTPRVAAEEAGHDRHKAWSWNLFGPVYTLFGLGLFLYVVHRLQ